MKKIKLETLKSTIASALFLASGGAYAVSGEPLAFDQYTATDGVVSANCANWTNNSGVNLTVSCGPELISDGMLQRQVTVSGSGDANYDGTYVQFILIDSGANGDAAALPFSTGRGSLYFTNEDFIKMNNRGGGIASKQTIIDSQFDSGTLTEDRFLMSTTYKNGWAQDNTQPYVDPWIDLIQETQQLVYDADIGLATSAVETYSGSFDLKSLPGAFAGSTSVDIDQYVGMFDGDPANDARQKFKHARRGGPYDASSSVIAGNPILPNGTNGGNLIWSASNAVAATWIGFENLNPGLAGIDLTFGYNKFQNLTGGTETSKYSFSDAEAATHWNSILDLANPSGLLFGPAPLMADVNAVSLTDFSVMTPTPLMGAANPDYIANSDSTLPAPTGSVVVTSSDYNQWTVTAGVFSGVACPAWAVTCSSSVINEGGLYQRWVVDGNGDQYLQTILVEDGTVTGDPQAADFAANSLGFVAESFVKQGAGSGIAGNFHLAERGPQTIAPPINDYELLSTANDLPSNGGDFIQNVELNKGWANVGSVGGQVQATVDINQSVIVRDRLALDAVSMQEDFSMQVGQTQADKRLKLYSRVGTQADWVDPIDFTTVTVSGDYQNTARAGIADPFILPGSVQSGDEQDLSWVAGDALQATFIAGVYGTSSPAGYSVIGSTSFINRTTGDQISYADINTIPPVVNNWYTDPFLAAPTYP
jgi:hypothetical protein